MDHVCNTPLVSSYLLLNKGMTICVYFNIVLTLTVALATIVFFGLLYRNVILDYTGPLLRVKVEYNHRNIVMNISKIKLLS